MPWSALYFIGRYLGHLVSTKDQGLAMLDPDFTPRGVSIGAAAAQLGISKTQVERMVAAGRLSALKVGHRTVVTVESIESYWASLPRATFPSRAPVKKARAQQAA